ncbi:MAG: reprolysin-like metallopeptidase [Anaerolineae bacterium]
MTHLLRSFLRWPLNLGPLALIVLAAAAIFALPGSTQGGPAPDLLAPTGGEVAFDGENIISRSRTVDINLGLLDTAADTFTFNFFDDAAFPVTFTDRYESPVGYTLTGTVEGFPLSTASMAVNGDTLTANVKINGAWYGIRHTGDSHVAQEFNEAAFPLDHPQDVPQWTAAPGAPAADVPEPQATVQLDVLVVYTRAARDAAGGKSSIENIAALAATETTNAYAKSGINAKLNLVHVEEVSYTESDGDAFSDALLDITYSDGFGYPEMDQVFDLRDEYHADFVALLIDDSQYCGVAWLNNNPESLGFADVAYSVTAWNCATG